jgi:transposase
MAAPVLRLPRCTEFYPPRVGPITFRFPDYLCASPSAKAGGCRACEGAVVQAPAPERPIDGGLATEALLAHVLVNKYADHLPLYRQSQIFARQGVNLDRSGIM